IESGLVALSEVKGLPRNPKEHDTGAIHVSIEEFGFIDRIIINRRTGMLISGHGRMKELRMRKAKGLERPDGIETTGNGEWTVPCDYVDIPAEDEEAAAIALNKLVERGGWDKGRLVEILSDLSIRGEDKLLVTGFDADDLDQMLRDLGDFESDDTDDEEPDDDLMGLADQLLEKWGTRVGDVWIFGERGEGHCVFVGDCRTEGPWTYIQHFYGSPNVVFTSPPYANRRGDDYASPSEVDYVDWWEKIQKYVNQHLANDGSFFVNVKAGAEGGERMLYVMDLVLAMKREWGWHFVDEFCWERLSTPGYWPNRFKNGFEPVFHFSKQMQIKFRPKSVGGGAGSAVAGENASTGSYYNLAGKTVSWDTALPTNRIGVKQNATATGHVAAFPSQLPEFFIRAFSDPGDLIVDPFAGSGSTAVAAVRAKRRSVSIELLPKYAAVCLERISVALGEEPKRVGEVENKDLVEKMVEKVKLWQKEQIA
ncbi:hypothetical protein LCGC14_2543730, partial [marine sediment metagenome]